MCCDGNDKEFVYMRRHGLQILRKGLDSALAFESDSIPVQRFFVRGSWFKESPLGSGIKLQVCIS